jgi:TPP-dependent trihydroxycyclohexane-1,2-dione (THcHDO) dehydratase
MTAQAYGAKGYRVEAADQLEDVLRQCQQNQVSCMLTISIVLVTLSGVQMHAPKKVDLQ